MSIKQKVENIQDFITSKIGYETDITNGVKALAESGGGFCFKIPPIGKFHGVTPNYVGTDGKISAVYTSVSGYEGFSLLLNELEQGANYTISFDFVCDRNLEISDNSKAHDGIVVRKYNTILATVLTFDITEQNKRIWQDGDISTTSKRISYTFNAPHAYSELCFGIGYVCCGWTISNVTIEKTE